jgi:hypothetical protein
MSTIHHIDPAAGAIPAKISCLLRQDGETGRWEGHCLDFDLVTSGSTEDVAWENLKKVVKRHVEHCFTNWQPGLTRRRASQCAFDAFNKLVQEDRPFRQDKLSLILEEPEHDQEHWLKAIAFPPEWIAGEKAEGCPIH